MLVGARYYDATVGRLISRDTRLDQRPYVYCAGDPVNALDQSGHIPKWVTNILKGILRKIFGGGGGGGSTNGGNGNGTGNSGNGKANIGNGTGNLGNGTVNKITIRRQVIHNGPTYIKILPGPCRCPRNYRCGQHCRKCR